MTIDILPSGSYRIRHTIDGKTYSVVVKEKPSEKTATKLIMEKVKHTEIKRINSDKNDFKFYTEKYLTANENVLSVATIRTYKTFTRTIPDWFLITPLCDISSDTIQRCINEYSITHEPKGTKSMYGFVKRILTVYRPDLRIMVNLPKSIEKDDYIPSSDDVKAILNAVKGSKWEIPFRLSCYGLRRGEIIALEYPADLSGNILSVNKTKVEDENHNWITKIPKTKESVREIWIDDELVELIRSQGYIYDGYPGKINQHLQVVQKQLGIPKFNLHKMRHYFATELSQSGMVSEADLLKMGGWSRKNATVMKSVYRHSQVDKDRERLKDISEIISGKLQ